MQSASQLSKTQRTARTGSARISRLMIVLTATAIGSAAAAQSTPQDRTQLPEPLQRYLRFAMPQPEPIKGMRMSLSGRVILPGKTESMPVTGTQYVSAEKPEFDWQVKADVNFLISAHIRDHYVEGKGSILSKANGIITLIDDADIPELNATQLARWSGLAVMAPPAMLLDRHFVWRQTGPDTVEATVEDGQVRIKHRFTFDRQGRMVRSESSDRWERYDGQYKQTGSIMTRSEYVDVAGYRVPRRFSVTRIEPDGSKTEFWVGQFEEIEPVRR